VWVGRASASDFGYILSEVGHLKVLLLRNKRERTISLESRRRYIMVPMGVLEQVERRRGNPIRRRGPHHGALAQGGDLRFAA
jgi:hypothetical protein